MAITARAANRLVERPHQIAQTPVCAITQLSARAPPLSIKQWTLFF